jgi:hypothetical protein
LTTSGWQVASFPDSVSIYVSQAIVFASKKALKMAFQTIFDGPFCSNSMTTQVTFKSFLVSLAVLS